MYYKEFLRVRKIFTGFAIAIGVVALLVLSFSGHATGSVSPLHGPAGQHAVLASLAAGDTNHVPTVGVRVRRDDGSPPIFEALFGIAAFIAAIFAMVVGCVLASENSGHLEVAWTRPVSRIGYGLRIVAVDWIGILSMLVFAFAVAAAVVTIEGWWPQRGAEHVDAGVVSTLLVFPLAWFGLVCALTASLRAGAGLVAGLSWPAASLAVALEVLHPHTLLSRILSVVNTVNPLLYVSFQDQGSNDVVQFLVGSQMASLVGLTLIALGGVAVGLLQWRRLEA